MKRQSLLPMFGEKVYGASYLTSVKTQHQKTNNIDKILFLLHIFLCSFQL